MVNKSDKQFIPHISWIDPIKAMALLAIMLNHFVEEFGIGPWFTNPSGTWPDLQTRIHTIFPQQFSFPLSCIQFLGWLGDNGPGVFILLSGFGLTWSALHRQNGNGVLEFYKRRLWKIFPLYIAAHVVLLFIVVFIPGIGVPVASPKMLLSLCGLRFTKGLFFFFNPSWWFVWLVLQLYLVYPFLLKMLQQWGKIRFLGIAILFTVGSRLFGISGIIHGDSIYYWMTGIFFGTRLAEFAIGMTIAAYLFKKGHASSFNTQKIAILSTLIYIAGFCASLFWPGTIISNMFIATGLTGTFYCIWEAGLKRLEPIKKIIIWIGVLSFPIFLIHQPLLQWTGNLTAGHKLLHLCFASMAIGISLPAGRVLQRTTSYFVNHGNSFLMYARTGLLLRLFALGMFLLMLFLPPRNWSNWIQSLVYLILGIVCTGLMIREYLLRNNIGRPIRPLDWAIGISGLFQIFFFHHFLVIVSIGAGACFALISIIIYGFVQLRSFAWGGSMAILVFFGVCTELICRLFFPIEVGAWGELPALEIHPTRIYSLKPNRTTHLRYNNYDYIVRTNSLGLPSPEFSIEKKDPHDLRILTIGDAFTMPEGLAVERGYSALLEKRLSEMVAPRHVQVVNAGVTGYGPNEECAQLAELAPLLKPDIVVYEFFIDEFLQVDLTREERLREIGFLPQDSWGGKKLFFRSQAVSHLQNIFVHSREILRNKPDDWRYQKALLAFYRTGQNPLYSEKVLANIKDRLARMRTSCKNVNSQFLIYFVPGAIAVSKTSDISYFPWDQDLSDTGKYDLNRPYRNLEKIAKELEIPTVDLTSFLRADTIQPVYFVSSWHWNEEGHKVVAQVIARDFKERGLLAP